MKRAVFEIAYEGPAVDDGIMDVRELAPALLSLGNLIENSNLIVGSPDIKVKVVVRSSFKKGSFQVALELICNLAEQVRMFLDLKNAELFSEKLLALIGFTSVTGLSLITFIKWLKGRDIKSATVLENGNVRIELEGDNGKFDWVEVDEKVIRLYRDRTARENLKGILTPLERGGINSFSIKKDKDTIERISKQEVSFYDVPEPSEEQQSNVFSRKTFVNLIEVAFEEGLKWRLSDGENKFYATIVDENFLAQMENDKTFAKGDVLEVELETTQTATQKGGIKNEHRVLKVINHLSKPRQIPMVFSSGNDKERKQE